MTTPVAQTTPAVADGIRFTVASRPQRRYSALQTVNNLNGGGSFNPISLPATGFVRKISLFFTATVAMSAAGAVGTNIDSPFNLINAVTVTDATGQPIVQPISGFNLYLINKYLPGCGVDNTWPSSNFYSDPQMGPEYSYSATATTGTAKFRLDIDFEQDSKTGYMSVPNLDSNASLQVKIDYGVVTNAFAGTITSSTLSVRIAQYYWAPVAATSGGKAVATHPIGFGDYLETRYETQTATASAENLLNINNRGGMIKGIIAVSRAAGVRTAFTAGSNVGLVYDNNAIDEGIPLEEHQDMLRRMFGYLGADLGASPLTPLSAGTLPGLDVGVIAWPFDGYNPTRDTWLNTRVGTQLQVKLTPGASATQIEFLTQIAQVKDAAAFYLES